MSAETSKLSANNSKLTADNSKLTAEISKLRAFHKVHKKPSERRGSSNSIETPPHSNSSDKSKEDASDHLLPEPPAPPEFLDKSPLAKTSSDQNSPKFADTLAVKRKRVATNKSEHQLKNVGDSHIRNPIRPTTSKNEDIFLVHNNKGIRPSRADLLDSSSPFESPREQQQMPANGAARSFFSPPARERRSVSPDHKRPALGSLAPPLRPPAVHPPLFRPNSSMYKGEPMHISDRHPSAGKQPFYDDSLADQASFRSPDRHRREMSPHFERASDSWCDSRQLAPRQLGPRTMGPPPPSWHPRQYAPRQPMQPPGARLMHPSEMRVPSFQPPSFSPNPPRLADPNRLPPWYRQQEGAAPPHNMRPPPPQQQVRSTSWITNISRR